MKTLKNLSKILQEECLASARLLDDLKEERMKMARTLGRMNLVEQVRKRSQAGTEITRKQLLKALHRDLNKIYESKSEQ